MSTLQINLDKPQNISVIINYILSKFHIPYSLISPRELSVEEFFHTVKNYYEYVNFSVELKESGLILYFKVDGIHCHTANDLNNTLKSNIILNSLVDNLYIDGDSFALSYSFSYLNKTIYYDRASMVKDYLNQVALRI